MHASLLTTTIGRTQSELRDAQFSHASEVTGVIAMVAKYTDAKDWAMLRAQFVDNVQLHFGKMKSPQQLGADAYLAWVMQAYGCGASKHAVRFHEVRIDLENSDLAHVTSYWQSSYRKPDSGEGEAVDTRFWCDHAMVRTKDGWKIAGIWATTLEENAFSRWSAQVSSAPARPGRDDRQERRTA